MRAFETGVSDFDKGDEPKCNGYGVAALHIINLRLALKAVATIVDAEFETEDKAERFDEMEQRLEAVGKITQEAMEL